MHSRYILQSILIDKDEDKLFDAIQWILDTDIVVKLETIKEDDKHYKVQYTDLPKEYFPILLETVNKEYGIHYLYYSKTHFPTPLNCRVKL
jgi:hypothetical protein